MKKYLSIILILSMTRLHGVEEDRHHYLPVQNLTLLGKAIKYSIDLVTWSSKPGLSVYRSDAEMRAIAQHKLMVAESKKKEEQQYMQQEEMNGIKSSLQSTLEEMLRIKAENEQFKARTLEEYAQLRAMISTNTSMMESHDNSLNQAFSLIANNANVGNDLRAHVGSHDQNIQEIRSLIAYNADACNETRDAVIKLEERIENISEQVTQASKEFPRRFTRGRPTGSITPSNNNRLSTQATRTVQENVRLFTAQPDNGPHRPQ